MAEDVVTSLEARQTAPLSSADALLASLREQGADRFDAAGWHYLDTLARRAKAHAGSAQRMLEEKLEQSAHALAGRFAQARAMAAVTLAKACQEFPQAAPQLQQLFAEGDFKGLRRLQGMLAARAQSAILSGLVSQLEAHSAAEAEQPSSRPLIADAQATSAASRELRTVRESRSTWARLSVDRQLSLAMRQAPTNAGPINSHMLVLRSLKMMQDISPGFLSHLVSYMDTLLALDPGEQIVPVKRKKSSPAKQAKPARPRG